MRGGASFLLCAMLFVSHSFEMDGIFKGVDPDNKLDFLGMCEHHGYEA